MSSVVLGAVLILYPIFIFFGLQYFSLGTVSGILALIFAVRCFIKPPALIKQQKNITITISIIGMSLVGFSWLKGSETGLRFYPVAVNFSMLALFGSTLIKPPSFIQTLASIKIKEMTPEIINYTRKVTILWCCVFFCNALVALYTAVACTMKTWTIYNGLVAYILVGIVFAGEFIVRSMVIKKRSSV